MKRNTFLVLFFILSIAVASFAQPANNTCATAQAVTPNGTCNAGTTVGASDTWPGVVGCQQSGGTHADVWYTFVSTGTVLDVNVTGGTLTTGMAFVLATGTCSPVPSTIVGSLCGGPNIRGEIEGLIAGQTYYFSVSGRQTTGTFTVCVESKPPPSNDEPCNAIALPIGGTCNYATYSNAGATASAGIPAPGCGNYLGGDVWFSVTVPANGNVTINSIQGAMTDGAMAAYSAPTCAGPFTLIECNDDGSENGLMPKLELTGRTPGQTIWIRFWEYGNNNNGTFGICVTSPATNNYCSTAQVITPDGSCVFGTTSGATDTWTGVVGCQSGDGHPDVWYRFVATGTQFDFTLNAGFGFGNAEVIVARGSSCAASFTITGSRCGPAPLSNFISGLIPGEIYYFTISNSGTPGPFSICVGNSTPPPVPGQDCSQPQILCNGNTTWHESPSGVGAIAENVSTNTCFSANESNSKWFRFTIGCSGTLGFRIEPDNSSDDYDWIVWNSPCAGVMGTAIACNWLGSSGGTGLNSNYLSEPNGLNPWYNSTAANYNLLNVTAGQTLTLLVNRYSGSSPGFTLSFEGTAVIGPHADFSLTPSNCSETVTVQATCSSTNSFNWTFGDGNGGTGPGPLVHNYAEADAYTIGLTVTDAFSCSAASSEIMPDELNITAIVNDASCNGEQDGSISLTVTGGSGMYTYDWDFGGNTATVTGLSAGEYTVRVTDSWGRCVLKTYNIDEPAPINVDAGPDQDLCSDATTLGGKDPDPGFTGTWSVVSGSAVFDDENSHNTNVSGLGIGSNILRWTVSDGTCSAFAEVTIFRNENTWINAGSDTTICAGNTVQFNATGSNNISSGQWTTSGLGSFDDDTIPNPVYTPSAEDIAAV